MSDAPGTAGFSGDELYAAATEAFSVVAVAWEGGTAPASDEFVLSFGPAGDVREVTSDQACETTGFSQMEVDADVALESADGEVVASGPATLISVALDEGMFIAMDIDAALTGAHAAAAASAIPDVERTYVGSAALYIDGALRQNFTIGVVGTDGDTGHNRVVYGCSEDAYTECISPAT